jgi:hypothetical protein
LSLKSAILDYLLLRSSLPSGPKEPLALLGLEC